eukprot:scaffold36729_cov68-Phaeocystis_antarctica.AAC.8
MQGRAASRRIGVIRHAGAARRYELRGRAVEWRPTADSPPAEGRLAGPSRGRRCTPASYAGRARRRACERRAAAAGWQ